MICSSKSPKFRWIQSSVCLDVQHRALEAPPVGSDWLHLGGSDWPYPDGSDWPYLGRSVWPHFGGSDWPYPYGSITPPHHSRGLWFAGGPLDLEPSPAGLSSHGQRIELHAHFGTIDGGGLALRWGGWLRTWEAKTHVGVALEIYDGDGTLWGRVEGGEVHAPEWTRVEYLTRIPAGASAVRLVLEADVEPLGTGVFADDLFVFPEKSPDSPL